MKKRSKALLTGNKGFTLVELMVALFIIAFILGSFMSIFIQSVKTRSAAEKVTRANAAGQQFAENLYAKDYTAVLALQGEKTSYNGYYLTFKLKPQGNNESSSTDDVSYVHIVFSSGGGCLIVAPDGTYANQTAAPYSISVNADSAQCTVTYDGVSLTSDASAHTAVIVYAMQKPTTTTTSIGLAAGISGVLYCTAVNAASVPVTGGTQTVYSSTVKADESLIRAVVEVYENSGDTEGIAVIESMIQVVNG